MKRAIYIIKVWLWMALLFAMTSCNLEVVESEELAVNECEHTIVMYLMADNNLSFSIYQNALDAEMGMIGALPSVRLVIYLDTNSKTELYEVRYLPYGENEHIRYCRTLKTYPWQTSTSPEVMRQVMEDVRRLAPSKSYGLVMSGHGSGWFPKPSSGTAYHSQKVAPQGGAAEFYFPSAAMPEPRTRFMGYDYEDSPEGARVPSYISTSEIVDGLQPIHFDYIIFDACFMSSVEFLYEMRNSADYIVASPVEIMACGLPYKEILGNLATAEHKVSRVCDIAMDVYMRDDSFSYEKSLALAVVDCSKLEALAESVRSAYLATGGSDHLAVLEERVNRAKVQHLDRMSPAAFYDLKDFVFELTKDEALREQFCAALEGVVINSVHTDSIYSLGYSSALDYSYDYITPREGAEKLSLCGINTYIPFAAAPLTNSLYMQTQWGQKVYSR